MQGAHIFSSQPGALSSGFSCLRISTPTVKAEDSLNLRSRSPKCSNVVSDRSISSSRVVPATAEKKVTTERSRIVPFDFPPRASIPRPLEFLWFRKSSSDIVRRDPAKPSTCKFQEGKSSVDTASQSASRRSADEREDFQDVADPWGESESRGDSISGNDPGDARTAEGRPRSDGNMGRDEDPELQNTDAENLWGWRPQLKSFLSFWNRSGKPESTTSVDAQMKQNVTEALVRQGAEALSRDMEGSKPVGASVWAIGELLHWRSDQQNEGSEGRELKIDGSESATQESKFGSCKECPAGACHLSEQGQGQPAGATIEAPIVEVVHTAETMEKFLGDVYPSDLRRIGLMSVLCDMAYTIPTIEPAELEKKYRLKFKTSSFELKAKFAAEEKARVARIEMAKEAKKLRSDSSEKRILKDIFLPGEGDDRATSLVQERMESEGQKGMAKRLSALGAVVCKDEAAAMYSSDEEAMACTDIDSRGIQRVGAEGAMRETEEVGLESGGQSERSGKSDLFCPCEWFACDDEVSGTRHFVIQGSDSLASWHTNVSFDPVVFEDPSLGVKVHRGIYDAAKALYATIMPAVTAFVEERGGATAKISLTGHSLGGSLATLLNFMLLLRGAVSPSSLLPVHTFGSPSIMCGGDHLLETLHLPKSHIQQVMMHRDLVPRAFACTYPDHVAEVLRRMSSAIRDHTCLTHQKLMYAPMGTMLVLQPEVTQSPFHPLLPAAPGLFRLRHPHQNEAELPHMRATCHSEVRAAQRAILNNPHPLVILADRGSYGTEGSISRDHDPRNYISGLNAVMRIEMRKTRRVQRERRRQMWWPLVGAEAMEGNLRASSGVVRSKSRRELAGVGGATLGVGGRGLRARGPDPSCQGLTSAGRSLLAANVGVGRKESKRRLHSLIASKHVEIGFLTLLTYTFLPLMQLEV